MTSHRAVRALVVGAGLVLTLIVLPTVLNIATSAPLPGPLAWIAARPWPVLACTGFFAVVLAWVQLTYVDDVSRARRTETRGRRLADAVLLIDRGGGSWRREALVAAAAERVRSGTRATVVYGLPGSGKTTIVAQAARELIGEIKYGVALTFEGYRAEDDSGFVVSQLNGFLAGFGRDLDEAVLQQSPRAALLRRLAVELRGLGVLVLVDDLHRAAPDTRRELLDALNGVEGVRVLAASDEAPTSRLPAEGLRVPELTPNEYRELARNLAAELGLDTDLDELLDRLPDEIRSSPRSLAITLGYLRDRPLELLPTSATSDAQLVAHAMATLDPETRQVLLLAALFRGCGLTELLARSAGAPGLRDALDVLLRRALIDRVQPTVELPALVVAGLSGLGGPEAEELCEQVSDALLAEARSRVAAGSDLAGTGQVMAAAAHNLSQLEGWAQLLKLCDRSVLDALNRQGHWSAFLMLLRVGIRVADGRDEDLALELRLRLGRKLTQLGEPGEAAALVETVASRVGEGEGVAQVRLATQHGLLALTRGDAQAAKVAFERSRDLAEALGDPALLATVYKQLGHTYQALGRVRLAREAFRTAIDHAPAKSKYSWDSLVNLAMLDLRAGRTTAARERVEQAVQGMTADRYAAGLPRANLAYAEIAFADGDRARALELAREVLAGPNHDGRVTDLAASMIRRFERATDG
ncbi:AAA family ATPase [Streptomyces sp. NPDC093544]|uniref:AAA family ATPase n=1 Tax=Streptomyces sp. NPDC093544 TaxID=3155200 RepID=UPI00342FCAFC